MRSFPILIIGLATLLIQPLVSHAAGTETSKPARQTITGKVTDSDGQPLIHHLARQRWHFRVTCLYLGLS